MFGYIWVFLDTFALGTIGYFWVLLGTFMYLEWLEMAGNGCKLMGLVGMAEHGCKWRETAVSASNWLECIDWF